MYTGKYFKVWFYSYSDQNNIQLKKKRIKSREYATFA